MSVVKLTSAVLATAMVMTASLVARSQNAKVEFLAVPLPPNFTDQSLTATLNRYAADGWDLAETVERISLDTGTAYRTAPVLILRRGPR